MMTILTFGLIACNEDFNEGVVPQANPQEEPQSYEGLTVELGDDFKKEVDLSAIPETSSLMAIKTTATPVLNEFARMTYVLELSNEAGFAKKAEVGADDGSVGADELNTAFREIFGKSPKQRDVFVRFRAYIAEGTARVSYGKHFDFKSIKMTPVPMDIPTIESGYYLIGDMNDWADKDPSKLIKLKHSDIDVYDDPTFSIVVQVPEPCYWKVIPQSHVDAFNAGTAGDVNGPGVLGCAKDGDVALEGKLVTENPQAMKIEQGGWTRITLNIMDGTYKVEPLGEISPYLWVPGDHQSWNPPTAPQLYSGSMDLIYNGHIYLNGGFKFTGQPAWPSNGVGVDYGYAFFSTVSANMTKDGDGNIVAKEGFYFLKADMSAKKLDVTEVKWGIIGAAIGGWEPANDVVMTYDKATNCWSVTADFVAGEYKFRANKNWDINMGGSVTKLEFSNSKNLNMTVAGNYTVKLYLTNDEGSYCELRKN